jgi:hypothetical protein
MIRAAFANTEGRALGDVLMGGVFDGLMVGVAVSLGLVVMLMSFNLIQI